MTPYPDGEEPNEVRDPWRMPEYPDDGPDNGNGNGGGGNDPDDDD